MKCLLDFVRGCGGEGASAPSGVANPRAKYQTDPIAGHVRRVSEKSLWQDVEFVPKIVEKVAG